MPRLTRKEKQAHTRKCLIEAAAKVFTRRGMERASIDEVAEDAGYTKGAFYANFKSKEELFLAMLDEKFGEEIQRIEKALSTDEAPSEAVRHAGEDFIRFARSDPEWERLYLEFVAYAVRNDDFRQELLTRSRAMEERLTEVYRRWNESVGIEPPIPLEDVTRITSIMTHGFLMNQQIDPDLREELYGTMLAAFLLGLREMRRAGDADAVSRARQPSPSAASAQRG
jgi:AcrR family transcriptional regulator